MPKKPLYPHVPKRREEEGKSEIRLHLLLTEQMDESLHDVIGKVFKIEKERVDRYGKTDPIAIKAEYLLRALRERRKEISNIADMLGEELEK